MAEDDRPLPARRPWDVATHALPGTRFATPRQYLAGVPGSMRSTRFRSVLVQALARAADADGVLLDFDYREFFETHVAAVLADLDEDTAPPAYDEFTEMVLLDAISGLIERDGLLALRGNGDSVDYRLTLPTTV
jgi:hypothetical protein